MKDWTRYYDAAGDDPRHTMLDALVRFDEPGFAVDLGCGTGRDTFELLRRGWRVLGTNTGTEKGALTVESYCSRAAPHQLVEHSQTAPVPPPVPQNGSSRMGR